MGLDSAGAHPATLAARFHVYELRSEVRPLSAMDS